MLVVGDGVSCRFVVRVRTASMFHRSSARYINKRTSNRCLTLLFSSSSLRAVRCDHVDASSFSARLSLADRSRVQWFVFVGVLMFHLILMFDRFIGFIDDDEFGKCNSAVCLLESIG